MTPESPAVGVQARDGGNLEPALCQPTATGPQTFFSLRVPPRTRATLRAVPAPTSRPWAPTIRLLDSCAARTCVANQLGGRSGTTTQLDFTNDGSAARDLVVTVAGWNGSDADLFNLSVGFTAL